MRNKPRFKMHYWSEPSAHSDDDFGPNIIDVTPGRSTKKLTFSEMYSLFCMGLMALAFVVVATPLAVGLLWFFYILVKVAFWGAS